MLLMKSPAAAPPPPEATLVVPGGAAACVPAVQGQLLTIEDVRGGQVAALFGFSSADPAEFLSPHHTRVFGGTFVLRLGTRLVTNRRRPILVLGRDAVRSHDLLLPASPDCREQVRQALAVAGATVPKIPDPVHLFMNVGLEPPGRLVPGPSRSKASDQVTFRVLIDATYVVAACRTALPGLSADPPTELRVTVHNELLPDQR